MTSNLFYIVLLLSVTILSVNGREEEEIKFKPNDTLSDIDIGDREINSRDRSKVSELKNIVITTSDNHNKDEKNNKKDGDTQQLFVDTDHRLGTANVKQEDDEEELNLTKMVLGGGDSNLTMESLLTHLDLDLLSLNRTKRQSLAGLNLASLLASSPNNPPQNSVNGNPNSVESLLASCQLTNLLMYQLLQQKQQQQQASQLISPAGLIPSFAVPGAINQNLIFPQAETLSTYLSTSTFVTTMTTTGLVTIPLFFGNKPSTTTITRTKTYEMTTSAVKTLTATIRPTYTQLPASALMSTVDLNPTPASLTDIEASILATTDLESSSNLKKNRFLESDEPTPSPVSNKVTKQTEQLSTNNKRQTTEETVSPKSSRSRGGGKRRKNSNSNSNSRTNNIGADNLHTNILTAKKNIENSERTRARDPAQYKILRDNRERQTSQPVNVNRDTYSNNNNNPFYEERDRTVAYNNRYNNNPTENYSPAQVSAPSTSPSRGANRGRITYAQQQQQLQEQAYYQQQRPVEIQPDPEYVQYPDDYGYYARRLKRGQQHQGGQREPISDSEEYPLEREYLLEPSFSGDYSQGLRVEKCPPVPVDLSAKTVTVTSTEIRTITKLVNPSSAVQRGSSRTFSRAQSGSNIEAPSSYNSNNSNNGESRSRGRSRSRSRSTTTTTTTPRTGGAILSGNDGGVDPEIYTGRRFRPRSRNYDYRT